MNWMRESVSDEHKQVDIAYVSIAVVVVIMAVSVAFICSMSVVVYARCTQVVDVGQGVRAAIPCEWDAWGVGSAVAAILAAFTGPVGALAGYMAATRRREIVDRREPPPGATVATASVTQFPADRQTPAKPKAKPATVTQLPRRRKPKRRVMG
jgi:heme/copper-type cytochrome/quinol oxidase subunit 2